MAFRTIGNALYVSSSCGLAVDPRGGNKSIYSVRLLGGSEYYIHREDEGKVLLEDYSAFNKSPKLVLTVIAGTRLIKTDDDGLSGSGHYGQKKFNHQVLVTDNDTRCSYFIDAIDAPEDFNQYLRVDSRTKQKFIGSNSVFSKLDYFKEVFGVFDKIVTGRNARLSVNKFTEGFEFNVKKHLMLLSDVETVYFSSKDVIKSMDARSFEAAYVVDGVLDKEVAWVLSINRTCLYVNDSSFDMVKYVTDAFGLNIKTYTIDKTEFMDAFNKVKDDVHITMNGLEDIFVKLLHIDEVGRTDTGIASILVMEDRPIYNYLEGYNIPFNNKIVEMIDSIISNLQLKDIGNWNNILNDYYGFNPTLCEGGVF